MNALRTISLDASTKVGVGAQWPEDVVVSVTCVIWLSDPTTGCERVMSHGGHVDSVASDAVLHIRIPVPGMPLVHPR